MVHSLAACAQITVGYALIAVINGVFLKETFSAAENDDKIMMRHWVFIDGSRFRTKWFVRRFRRHPHCTTMVSTRFHRRMVLETNLLHMGFPPIEWPLRQHGEKARSAHQEDEVLVRGGPLRNACTPTKLYYMTNWAMHPNIGNCPSSVCGNAGIFRTAAMSTIYHATDFFSCSLNASYLWRS